MFKKIIFFSSVALCSTLETKSDLDFIIAPEIKNDDFYETIFKLASQENISTILEIGSSSGQGSTQAFVEGIKKNASHPTLYCMELSKVRFAQLQDCYKDLSFVQCYNVSSVPLASFPSEEAVTHFYGSIKTTLNQYPLNTVLRWLKQDVDYILQANVITNGIEFIKQKNNIKTFDMVLIDGSEFTGMAELEVVYGATFILLDDINAFKNYFNFHRLNRDPHYRLIAVNSKLRNGYAVFKKVF